MKKLFDYRFYEKSSASEKSLFSLQNVLNKLFFGLVLTLFSASLTYYYYLSKLQEATIEAMGRDMKVGFFVANFVALGCVVFVYRSPWQVKWFFMPYAISQGFLLGLSTFMVDRILPGVGLQALIGTLAVVGATILVYQQQWIKVTSGMQKAVHLCWVSLLFVMLANLALHFLGISTFLQQALFESSPHWFSILLSGALIILGSLTLMIQVNKVQLLEKMQVVADPRLEWYCALGLLSTVIWIYVQVLDLLVKLQRR